MLNIVTLIAINFMIYDQNVLFIINLCLIYWFGLRIVENVLLLRLGLDFDQIYIMWVFSYREIRRDWGLVIDNMGFELLFMGSCGILISLSILLYMGSYQFLLDREVLLLIYWLVLNRFEFDLLHSLCLLLLELGLCLV